MSTIKANTIQSLSGSDSIKIRTNAQDNLTVDSSTTDCEVCTVIFVG